MIQTIPGTVLPFEQGSENNAFRVISPIFTVTNGLTLAQLRELTGLESSTIQNWIKRGWVSKPQGKRYGEQQAVRIILINSIRSAMQIEKIAHIMTYINNDVDCRDDDIISDVELFNIFCKTVWLCDSEKTMDRQIIKEIIAAQLVDYEEVVAGSKERLSSALLVMALAYLTAQLKEKTDQEFSNIQAQIDEENNAEKGE